MFRVYRSLLYLYSARYRREFGDEMTSVFREAERTLSKGFSCRTSFYFREFTGLIAGAALDRLPSFTGPPDWSSPRRFNMRRFPTSTITLMIVILAGVVLAIESAKTVQVKYDASAISVWDTLPGFVAIGLALVCCVAVAGWAILFALHRSGIHRLSDVQTWSDQR